MYTIYVVFECFEGKREAFVEKVRSEGIVDAVRKEDGCYRYDYYYSEKDPNELFPVVGPFVLRNVTRAQVIKFKQFLNQEGSQYGKP